jgi:hypothetical protein
VYTDEIIMRKTLCDIIRKIWSVYFVNRVLEAEAEIRQLCVKHRQTASSFFYSQTETQVNCLKSIFKIYIKIDIKTSSTCFGAITIIRERIIRAF